MKTKKKLMIVYLQILLLCIVLPTHIRLLIAESPPSVLINEIMVHPTENENTNEWIELYNPTSEPIDVAGWTIADEKETDTLQADSDHGDGTTTIPPEGYALITDKGTTVYETATVAENAIRLSVDDSTLCGYGLNNQKEKIILIDLESTVIDAIEWGEDYDDVPGSPALVPSKGNSLIRYQAIDNNDSSLDFSESTTPTPGSENIRPTPNDQSSTTEPDESTGYTSPSVLITELFYDTHPNLNAEYVRLSNPTNTSVDVSGWYLTDEPWKEPDDQPKILFPEYTQMPANTSWYITKNATAFLRETALLPDFEYAVDSQPMVPQLPTNKMVTYSNTGGLVGLYSASQTLIDLIIYGTTDEYISCWEGPSIPTSGQGVILKRNYVNGTPVDTNTAADWIHARIYHIGQSDFPLQTIASTGEITVFVSPDNSYETIVNELRNAQISIDMNMYEFTNPFLFDELLAALKRNVTVRLFMEGAPIGGMDNQEKYILSTIAAHGGSIRCIVNDKEKQVYARYQFDHAKYLIIDNETVIVESCNWAKTGVPKNPTYGNREWGIVVRDKEVAAQFSQVFQEDYNPQHADSYPLNAMNITIPPGFFLDKKAQAGTYHPRFVARTITEPFTITPLFSPDTSEHTILDAIDASKATLYVQQLYIYKDWDDELSPFVQHLINKSQQGVLVQVILDYNPEYEATTAVLNETKQFLETYGVKVKFISSEWSPFTTIHNKGMIIDNTTVLISSVNWNEQSVRKNREAGILLKNQEAATYYATVFLSDWNLDPQKTKTSDFSWAEYKYLLLIAVVFSITITLIARDWRKRKWK
jgi:cardiolipin synthase A/B